jgi:hypothetical protein
MDDNEVVIEGTWTSAEMGRAARHAYLIKPHDVALLAFLLLVGVALHQFLIFLFCCVVVFPIAVFYLRPMHTWRINPEVHNNIVYTVNEDGIKAVSNKFEAREEWSSYSRSRETAEFYILRRSDVRRNEVLSKRWIKNSRDESILRTLLSEHTTASLRHDASSNKEEKSD